LAEYFLLVVIAESPKFLQSETHQKRQDESGASRHNQKPFEQPVENEQKNQIGGAGETAGDKEFND